MVLEHSVLPILVRKLVTWVIHFGTRLCVYWSSQQTNAAPNHAFGREVVPQLPSDFTSVDE